jgi:hypothetical protein
VRHQLDQALVATARSSQALVIESLDRVVRTPHNRALRTATQLARPQLGLLSQLLEGPAGAIDDNYDLLQGLTALHREFTQRLFEVIGSHGVIPPTVD